MSGTRGEGRKSERERNEGEERGGRRNTHGSKEKMREGWRKGESDIKEQGQKEGGRSRKRNRH